MININNNNNNITTNNLITSPSSSKTPSISSSSSLSSTSITAAAATITTTILNRKRTLIEDFLSSNDDNIKELQIDDHAIEAIFDQLEHPERDIELFKLITKRLYDLYKSQDRELRLKTILFIPTLIAIYIDNYHKNNCCFNKINDNDKSEPNSSIAILLMCIYNFEIINQKTGDLKTIDIRLISLTKPSIYHEQSAHIFGQASIPTEQMLAKINNPQESRITIFGPYHEVEQLNTGNQQSIFTVLMKIYNQHIQEVGFYSWQSMLRLYLNLLKQGNQFQRDCIELKQQIKSILSNNNNKQLDCIDIKSNTLQIQFTSEFLTELTKAAYFCYYNEFEDLATELLDEICKRSTFRLYGDVILMINAFKNTQAIINRDREDHREKIKNMNKSEISLNTTQTVTTMTSVSSRKAAITNASFKTKKLPDDIPIVVGPANNTSNVITKQPANTTMNAQKAHLKNSLSPRSSSQLLSQQQQQQQQQSHQKQNGHNLFKSLDSINEESSSPSNNNNNNVKLSNDLSSNNKKTSTTTKSISSSRKGVINMLKELKESTQSKSQSSKNKQSSTNKHCETNGKLSSININNHNKHNNNQNESIQMKQIKKPKKFIDDDDNDNYDDVDDDDDDIINNDEIDRSSNDDRINILNPPLAPLERFTDDDDDINTNVQTIDGNNIHQNQRFKLIIEVNNDDQHLSSDQQSDRSSGASAVALLGNNKQQQQQSNSTTTNSSSMIKF